MEYFIQTLWLLSWPLLIYISYLSIRWGVDRFEKRELEKPPFDEI